MDLAKLEALKKEWDAVDDGDAHAYIPRKRYHAALHSDADDLIAAAKLVDELKWGFSLLYKSQPRGFSSCPECTVGKGRGHLKECRIAKLAKGCRAPRKP